MLTGHCKSASCSFAAGLLVGGLGIYYLNTRQIASLRGEVTDLQSQIATFNGAQNQTVINQSITVSQNGINLPDLYANVSNAVVLVLEPPAPAQSKAQVCLRLLGATCCDN
jgi:hypothetical protein